MKRIIQLFIRTYGLFGIMIFTIYFALLYFIVLHVMPTTWFESFAYKVGAYYESIRYVSYAIHIMICFLVVRFIVKLVNNEIFIVRRKTLAFLGAAVVIQFFGLFSSIYVPEILQNDPYYKHQVEIVTTSGFYWLEWISLIMTGYLLPFYIGALKLVKFDHDMLIAPVKKK